MEWTDLCEIIDHWWYVLGAVELLHIVEVECADLQYWYGFFTFRQALTITSKLVSLDEWENLVSLYGICQQFPFTRGPDTCSYTICLDLNDSMTKAESMNIQKDFLLLVFVLVQDPKAPTIFHLSLFHPNLHFLFYGALRPCNVLTVFWCLFYQSIFKLQGRNVY